MTNQRAVARMALLACVLSAACAGADIGEGTFVEQDSAGVLLAQSGGPAWSAGEGWRVAREPTLEIGSVDGEAAYQLDAVAGATRLTDGRIVIADGGSSTVRWYDASGAFLFQRGGEGEGPDEFRRVVGLVRMGTARFGVHDATRRVVAVYENDGARAQDAALGAWYTGGGSPAYGPDVGWVGWLSTSSRSLLEIPEGRDTMALVVQPVGGAAALDTLGLYPGFFRRIMIDRDLTGQVTRVSITRPAYPDGAELAVGGGRIVVGTGLEHGLQIMAPNGTLQRSIRWDGPDLTVTDAVRAEYRAAQEAAYRADPENPYEGDEPALQAALARIGFPFTRSAYVGIRLDPGGNIWLEQPRLPGDQTERHMVLDPSGRQLGFVTMPDGLTTFEIGDDYVLGRWSDDLDVQYVRLHTLERR